MVTAQSYEHQLEGVLLVLNRARRNPWALPWARATFPGVFPPHTLTVSSLASGVGDRSRTKPVLPSFITKVFIIALTVCRALFFKNTLGS